MGASRQQKCGLVFAAVCCLIFGGAITVCGFLFNYLEPYDAANVNGQRYDEYEFYYTQYWLGIPLFVLGVVLLIFLCCKLKVVLVLCIILSSFTLILSIAAVVLEGPKWRSWISMANYVQHEDGKTINGGCIVMKAPPFILGSAQDPLSCREVYFATVMQSIVVACSILGIFISHFTAFVSIRVAGWMSRGTYDMKQPDNSMMQNNYNSGVITSEM